MCEMLAIASPTPVPMDEVLRWSMLLDEFGVAGFSWGMVWTEGQTLHRYRSVDGIRHDPAAASSLRGLSLTRGYVHLRRPSYMSTISHVNAQPYLSGDGEWAFGHNGLLQRHHQFRAQYQSLLDGTSDSEVGFQYWLEQLRAGTNLAQSLEETHRMLEGKANFMALHRSGHMGLYAGNSENPVYMFRLGSTLMATTSLHSPDHFVFDTIFPGAVEISQVDYGTAAIVPAMA